MRNATIRSELTKPLSPEARAKHIETIASVAFRDIRVQDGRASLYVPVPVFLDHVDDDALRLIMSHLSGIAVWLAGCAGRLDADTFRWACSQPLFEVVDKIEEAVFTRMGDVARGGVPNRRFDDIFPECADDPRKASAIILSGFADLLDKLPGEIHQRGKFVHKRKR